MPASSPLAQFLKWEKEIPDEIFLRQPFNGVWKTWTWVQAGEEARRIASGLKSLHLPDKSHIAILSKNCAQWIISDLAIMMAGYISIPIYPTLTAHSIQSILVHSDTKAIIIGKLDDFDLQKDRIPTDVIRISMETYGIKTEYTLENFIAQQPALKDIYDWQADDIFTIIYTSGTTGKSKGVMHDIGACDSVIQTAFKELSLPLRPKLFSFLPMSHIAERVGIEMNGLYSGAYISFAESLESFAKNLADTQPDEFFAVPRIWGKFREKILEKLPQKKLNLLLSIPFVNGMIKKKIRRNLGLAAATHIYSAAAPLSFDLMHWFNKLGITICQAYGMTEDCVYSHFCSPQANRFGTVGKPLPGVQVKISEEGEIRKKSKGDMKGYYKENEMTAEAFDEQGYLKTGDMGEYDNDGYLLITGRVKDIFKTDKGKYIAPAPIEIQYLTDTNIEQVCVVGTGVPQPMALVTLSEAGKKRSKDELAGSLSRLLAIINGSLEKFEMLEKIVIMKESWTIANGLITPTLKVKRNEIEKLHLPKYPTWFDEKGIVIWEK
jgi:long-chain acyl-CoA synthetase